jgi:type IV pilus assembly protein PilA
MKSMQKGFTLIELMIVVAIIAILAAIAIPQYQTYVIRSQFTRVMSEAGDQKVVVEDCINNNETTVGTAAGNCIETATSSDLIGTTSGAPSAGLPALAIDPTSKSTIIATFGNHANPNLSGSVQWTRSASGTWVCGTSIANAALYAPIACQGAVGG